MAIPDQIIGLESGGDPNATNPRSSATGLGQFLSGTWLDMIKRYHPELASLPQQEILGLRSNPALSREMTAAYAKENGDYLAQKGLPVTDGTTYLAHFAGPAGAAKVLNADPNAPVSDVLGPAVVQANPFLKDMKVADLTAWADRKMGAAPSVSGPAAPALGAPVPQAMPDVQQQVQPQPALPAYPFSPQQQQAQPEMQLPAPLSAPAINYAPRRYNIADALSRIPTPGTFRGFSYFRG